MCRFCCGDGAGEVGGHWGGDDGSGILLISSSPPSPRPLIAKEPRDYCGEEVSIQRGMN